MIPVAATTRGILQRSTFVFYHSRLLYAVRMHTVGVRIAYAALLGGCPFIPDIGASVPAFFPLDADDIGALTTLCCRRHAQPFREIERRQFFA